MRADPLSSTASASKQRNTKTKTPFPSTLARTAKMANDGVYSGLVRAKIDPRICDALDEVKRLGAGYLGVMATACVL